MLARILAAVDRSPVNEVVFEQARYLARLSGATLYLLHVLTSRERAAPNLQPGLSVTNLYFPQYGGEMIRDYRHEWGSFERESLDRLQALVGRAQAQGISAEYVQVAGKPSRRICEFARDWNVDLVVVGRRGRAGLRRLSLGRVSNHVVNHAPCAVWVADASRPSQAEAEDERAAALAQP